MIIYRHAQTVHSVYCSMIVIIWIIIDINIQTRPVVVVFSAKLCHIIVNTKRPSAPMVWLQTRTQLARSLYTLRYRMEICFSFSPTSTLRANQPSIASGLNQYVWSAKMSHRKPKLGAPSVLLDGAHYQFTSCSLWKWEGILEYLNDLS